MDSVVTWVAKGFRGILAAVQTPMLTDYLLWSVFLLRRLPFASTMNPLVGENGHEPVGELASRVDAGVEEGEQHVADVREGVRNESWACGG